MHQLLTSVCCVRSVFGSSNSLLYVGGVADIETLLQRPGQVHSHGYSGCLRNVLFDGEEVFHTAPHATAGVTDGCARGDDRCADDTCDNGLCVDNWRQLDCVCQAGYAGDTCADGTSAATCV